MAADAMLTHEALHLDKAHRLHRHCRNLGRRRPQSHDDTQDHHHAHRRKGPGVGGAAQVKGVALHKELADQSAGQHHHEQQHPTVLVRVQKAVVVAQHRKDDGQGEIGVVHAALLTALAVDGQRIGVIVFTGRHGGHHLALAGDDPEKNVGAHRGGDHGAYQQEGGAASKQLVGQPGTKRHDHDHQARHNQLTIFAETEHAADGVVDQPERHQQTHSGRSGHHGRPVHQRLVDQESARVVQVEHREQSKTSQPRGISFPIKPMELGVNDLGGDHVLLRVVKTAAVHRPHGTTHTFFQQVR